MPITATGIEFNCPIHGTVKARQYNIGNAEREYFGCGYCKEYHFFPLSGSELQIKMPDQVLTDAKAEIARLQAENQGLANALHDADQKLSSARNDALEEAANIAESYWQRSRNNDERDMADIIEQAIRAIKT